MAAGENTLLERLASAVLGVILATGAGSTPASAAPLGQPVTTASGPMRGSPGNEASNGSEERREEGRLWVGVVVAWEVDALATREVVIIAVRWEAMIFVVGSADPFRDGTDVVCDLQRTGNGPFTLTATYVQGLGIDSKMMKILANGTQQNYVTDALGSVHMVTTAGGAILNRTLTTAWGEVLAEMGSASDRHEGLAQREIDVESGVQYTRERAYLRSIGRFAQKDPLSVVADQYKYVENGPLGGGDPLGLQGRGFWGPRPYPEEWVRAGRSFERNVQEPTEAFAAGAAEVVAEPVYAIYDIGLGTGAIVWGVQLEELDFKSMSSRATQMRRLEGMGAAEAVAAGEVRTLLNIGTFGGYSLAEYHAPAIWYLATGDVTYMDRTNTEYARGAWRMAGGLSAAAGTGVFLGSVSEGGLSSPAAARGTTGASLTRAPHVEPLSVVPRFASLDASRGISYSEPSPVPVGLAPPEGPFIWVMTLEGGFRFAARPFSSRASPLPHPILSGGRSVLAAGQGFARPSGQIIYLDRQSGHFQPLPEHLRGAVLELERLGLVNRETTVVYEIRK